MAAHANPRRLIVAGSGYSAPRGARGPANRFGTAASIELSSDVLLTQKGIVTVSRFGS